MTLFFLELEGMRNGMFRTAFFTFSMLMVLCHVAFTEELSSKPSVVILGNSENVKLGDVAALWLMSQCSEMVSVSNAVGTGRADGCYLSCEAVLVFEHGPLPPQSTTGISLCGLVISNKIAIIDIEKLGGKISNMTSLAHRVEKTALFAVCRILGLSECPFPRCVMKPCVSLEQLDLKARGLCPPCSSKLIGLLENRRRKQHIDRR